MFSPAIRKPHLHRRDKEDASASPPPATAAPFHSPSPRGFAVPDLPVTGTQAPWTSSSLLSREVTSPILATAKRHEGYQTLWQICYDISDTVPLRNLMHGSVGPHGGFSFFVFKQLINSCQYAKLLRLENLHTCALLACPEEDTDLTGNRKTLSFVERRRLLYLSKIAATAGKDINYEVKVARIDGDIRILKLQEEIVQHDPEYAQGKYKSKLLRPSELIEMWLNRG